MVVAERKLAGTPVTYLEVGEGPPTILIHGLNSFAHDWADVGRALAARGRQVLIPYRRGRAPSGPLGPGYGLSVEVDDACALLDRAGPGATLVGHSFGGVVALLVTAQRPDIGALVLYEPALLGDRPGFGTAVERIEAAVAANDLDTALATIVTDIDGDPPTRVMELRAGPDWSRLVAMVSTAAGELAALRDLAELDLSLKVRTTVLLGDRVDEPFGPPARRVAQELPGARLVLLPGQGHLAHVEAPAALAAAIDAGAVPV
jgi:pimeloyl-ACP methyl ester carboxylesterase